MKVLQGRFERNKQKIPFGYGWLTLLLLGFAHTALAQHTYTDTLRQVNADTVHLQHADLIPFTETLLASSGKVSPGAYYLDYFRGLLLVKDKSLFGLKLTLRYQTFDRKPPASLALHTLKPIDPIQAMLDLGKPTRQDSIRQKQKNETLMELADTTSPKASAGDGSHLERSGSISRAITVGTNRDLGVSSDFRLQLNGQLGDGIEVAAAITDNNIPIQPSGTTQQLADFDKIFIQLKRGGQSVAFGDMEVIEKNTYFTNLYRNVQGLGLGVQGKQAGFRLYGASSKGDFNTNTFQGENGKQGPYRLTGRKNETFIIVLAGSERVYLNGRLLVRGVAQDYTIEYNIGQVTFTPRQLIDANTRIVIDFEYSVRNYSRSLIFGEVTGKAFQNRLDFRLSYGREADDPNSPIDVTLTDSLKKELSLGASPLVPGVDSTGYNRSTVNYARRDTLVSGKLYKSIYVYSNDSVRARYHLSFTYVGPHKGDYVRDAALINGNIYSWVAPDSNGHSGDYAPVRLIPLPKSLQVLDFGASFRLGKYMRVYTETGISNENRNRFALSDTAQSTAIATRTGIQLAQLPIAPQLTLSSEASFQYVDAHYTNFDRVYAKEYGRDWNYNDLGARANERVAELSTELRYREKYRLKLSTGYRGYGDSLHTTRYAMEAESIDSTTVMGKNIFTYLVTQNTLSGLSSAWVRDNGDVYRLIGGHHPWLRIGSEIWAEDKRNDLAGKPQDGSFSFADLKPYIRSVGKHTFQYDLSVEYRYDRAYLDSAQRAKALTFKPYLHLLYRPGATLSLENTTTYLNYRLLDTHFEAQGLSNQQTLLDYLSSNYTSRNKGVQGILFYQISTEEIAKQNISYVQVSPGLGQYDWIDYNKDGIQQLNEFQLSANPLLANFIRVLTPTQALYPVISLSLGGTLRLDFRQLLGPPGSGPGGFLRQLSTLTYLRVDQKENSPTGKLSSYLISLRHVAQTDTSVLSSLLSFRQDIFFFKNSSKGDISFSYLSNQNRQFLNSGVEEGHVNTLQTHQRLNLDSRRSFENLLSYGTQSEWAQLLPTSDFNIQSVRESPALNFQLSRSIRLTAGYEYRYKTNRSLEGTVDSKVITHKLSAECRMSFKAHNTVQLKLDVLNNNQQGVPTTSANYTLLEGLQPGKNMVWNVLITQTLNKVLELTVEYDGRASESAPMIQSARMQLRAIF